MKRILRSVLGAFLPADIHFLYAMTLMTVKIDYLQNWMEPVKAHDGGVPPVNKPWFKYKGTVWCPEYDI